MITKADLEWLEQRVVYCEQMAEDNFGNSYWLTQAHMAADALAQRQVAYDRQEDNPCEHGVPYSLCQAGCASLA